MERKEISSIGRIIILSAFAAFIAQFVHELGHCLILLLNGNEYSGALAIYFYQSP